MGKSEIKIEGCKSDRQSYKESRIWWLWFSSTLHILWYSSLWLKDKKQPCQSQQVNGLWGNCIKTILRVWGVESAGSMVPADGVMHRGLSLALAMSPQPTRVHASLSKWETGLLRKLASGLGVTWAEGGCWFWGGHRNLECVHGPECKCCMLAVSATLNQMLSGGPVWGECIRVQIGSGYLWLCLCCSRQLCFWHPLTASTEVWMVMPTQRRRSHM